MNKPWDIKPNDIRQADELYTFIIFCEDEVSEYHYFKWFETSLIKVNVINKQKSMLSNITKAVAYCQQHGILSFANGKYSNENDGIEIWCVFDRDKETDPQVAAEKNIEFNISIKTANDNDINVAWSNDAFELWVLLHLMEVDHNNPATAERIYYYEQLTNYFKAHPNPNDDLLKCLQYRNFNYKEGLKNRTNFVNIVRSEILPLTNIAIARSKSLALAHAGKENHFDKKPCTLVHILVEALLEKGKKVIP